MKQTPEELKLKENFLPGKISREGFLGHDDRHIHEIVAEDAKVLEGRHVTTEMIALKLAELIEKGKDGLENPVQFGPYTIQIQWDRGMLPCPFGDKPTASADGLSLRE